MDKDTEYERLCQLELETTKLRYTTFTALLSISFVIAGFAANADSSAIQMFGLETSVRKLVFLLGFIFNLVSLFHYLWYHRYSHLYRKALKDIENSLGISVYRLRVRPQIGPFKLHFVWVLYIVAIVYGFIVAVIVGGKLFFCCMAVIAVLYVVLLLASYWDSSEPLERD
ncbi:MAG: hypothetical protein ACRD51_04425 [Candidatus Acidiferrum sp.]